MLLNFIGLSESSPPFHARSPWKFTGFLQTEKSIKSKMFLTLSFEGLMCWSEKLFNLTLKGEPGKEGQRTMERNSWKWGAGDPEVP